MTDTTPTPVSGQPVLAVFLGFLIVMVISITAVMTFGFLYYVYQILQGYELELIKGMFSQVADSPLGMTLLFSSGAIASMTSGYVCASIAKENVVKPVTAYITLILLLGFIAIFQSEPDWTMLLSGKVLTILMIVLGAWLYVRKQPGHPVPQPE